MEKPRSFEEALDIVLADMKSVMIRKDLDYGPGNISAFGELGVLVRSSDKLERLKRLVMRDRIPNNETVEDSWLDLANYAVIAQMWRQGWWNLPRESESQELSGET